MCVRAARKTMKKQKSEGAILPMKRLALPESLNLFSSFIILVFEVCCA